ncbi:hypothetical protein, partial [Marixanthomonas ophiurae]
LLPVGAGHDYRRRTYDCLLYHATRRTGAGSAQQSPGHGACHHTHAETSALHHYVPDLHRRMLLATLWNTYICINEALTVFIRLWEAE